MSLPAQESSIAPGQILNGRFEVRGLAVSDGFGQVLAAHDHKTQKPVSLRVLRSQALVAAVRQQLNALGTAAYPNVLPSYGVLPLDANTGLLVQGPLAGHHLAEYVRQRSAGGKPISLRGAYNVVAHVCNALTAVHGTGPHGAVRPGAVWIGDDGRVQLADLLIARALLGGGGTGGLPEPEASYLAPELKAGHPPLPASDIFGLGALLYELLTCRSPNEEFVPPSQVHPEANAQVDGELFKALSPDPAQRHQTPDEFRNALLALMGKATQETTEDFGIDIEVEVNLASMPPRARSSAPPAVHVPKAPRPPQVDRLSMPQAGTRVSIYEEFRESQIIDEQELEAARRRTSLGEVDLKDVLAKITEDDAPRWMVVKNGMDHGPFSGRQLVNAIVQGEALRDHELLNTDTGRRGKLGEFPEFEEFLRQYELRHAEEMRKKALASAETKEKRSALFKAGTGLAIVAVLALGGGIYAMTRSESDNKRAGEESDDLYKRGQLEISGSAGILPAPKKGARRSSGGGSGSGMSYEEAMMQAVDIGSASGGGEKQLSPAQVAGVMNRNLNSIAGACVRGSVGTVKIDMAIAGSGQVLGVTVTGGDANLQRCVADQVRRIKFPSFQAPRMGARFTFGT